MLASRHLLLTSGCASALAASPAALADSPSVTLTGRPDDEELIRLSLGTPLP